MNYFLFLGSWFRYLNVHAANAHQHSGATINIRTTFKLAKPSKRAGQKLLAGFTDVPVNHSQRRWTRTNANHITIPAILLYSSFEVTHRIVYTNTKVRMISASNQSKIFQSTLSNPLDQRTEKSRHNSTQRINAPKIPHMNWAST